MRCGNEYGILSHSAAETALDDFRHFEGELTCVEGFFCLFVFGAENVDFFLGKCDVLFVGTDDGCFDSVACLEVGGVVVVVDRSVSLINETVFLATYCDINTVLVRSDDVTLNTLADLVVDKTDRTRRSDYVFHRDFFSCAGA